MRLPRKEKKKVKKIVAAKNAYKTLMSAMVASQAMAQSSIIVSNVFPQLAPSMTAYKALRVANVAIEAAQAIKKIRSEPPNSWRDFARAK